MGPLLPGVSLLSSYRPMQSREPSFAPLIRHASLIAGSGVHLPEDSSTRLSTSTHFVRCALRLPSALSACPHFVGPFASIAAPPFGRCLRPSASLPWSTIALISFAYTLPGKSFGLRCRLPSLWPAASSTAWSVRLLHSPTLPMLSLHSTISATELFGYIHILDLWLR